MATGRIGLAAILLDRSLLRSAKTYCEAVQQMLPDIPVSVLESECSEEVRVLKVGASEVYIPLMPPFPWQNLVTLTETSWHWKESRDLLRLHNAHILVTLRLGPPDPIEHAMFLSKVTAAIMSAQDCLGVYWYGPAISPAKMFMTEVKAASEGGRFPLLSWLSFGLAADELGVRVVTQGMDELGHKELEVIARPEDGTAFEYTLTLCDQVLKKGPILRHGETIGRTPQERYAVVHRPASWDNTREAIEIDMRKNVNRLKGVFGKIFGK